MSDDMKKTEKIENRAQQGIDQELSTWAETEQKRGSKRPATGA